MSNTGEHKAVETEATTEDPVTGKELRRQFKWQDVAVVLAILAGFLGGYRTLLTEARAESDAGVKSLESRVNAVETEQKNVRSDLHEVQLDIRELYRSQHEGRRSERLERPLPPPDGGPP